VRVGNGLPVTYTNTDSFAHSGVGLLVNTSGNIYHSEKESFMRFEQVGDCNASEGCSWTVTNVSSWFNVMIALIV